MADSTKKSRKIAISFIEILDKADIEARMWNKIKNFIDLQYESEKDKSKLNYDKNALEKQVNGQIW